MNKIFHNLLSLLIPFFSLSTLYSYIADLFPQYDGLKIKELFLILAIGIVCQIIFAISKEEKTSTFANFRLFVLMYITIFIVLVFINTGSFLERIKPNITQILMMLMLAIQFIWSRHLANLFFEQEQFYTFCKDYTGDTLYSKLREQGELMSASRTSLNASLVLSLLPLISISILSLIIGGDMFLINGTTIFFTCGSATLFLITFTYSSITNDERYYARQGLECIFEKGWTRFRNAMKIIAGSLFLGIIYVSQDAIFVKNGQTPFYKRFLKWLFDLLNRIPEKKVQTEKVLPEMIKNTPQPFEDFSLPSELGNNIIDLSWLTELLKTVGEIALVIIFLVAIFGPFFKKDWRDFWKNGKLFVYMKKFFASCKKMIQELFFNKNTEKKVKAYSAKSKSLMDSFDQFAHLKKTKEKKNEIGRLSKKYIELCEWGESNDCECSNATAPMEYALQLGESIHREGETLVIIAEIFEKALFSDKLLKKEEENVFNTGILKIINLDLTQEKKTGKA